MATFGNYWKLLVIFGNIQWQSVAVFCSQWQFQFLQRPSIEYLEFLEIRRFFKFEDIITMVRRSGGGATPPSVMALFNSKFEI